MSPGWCSSVDWVLACEPKGSWFKSQSEHMPGSQARSPVGGAWEATTHWCFSPSLSPLLPLSIKRKKEKEKKENWISSLNKEREKKKRKIMCWRDVKCWATVIRKIPITSSLWRDQWRRGTDQTPVKSKETWPFQSICWQKYNLCTTLGPPWLLSKAPMVQEPTGSPSRKPLFLPWEGADGSESVLLWFWGTILAARAVLHQVKPKRPLKYFWESTCCCLPTWALSTPLKRPLTGRRFGHEVKGEHVGDFHR